MNQIMGVNGVIVMATLLLLAAAIRASPSTAYFSTFLTTDNVTVLEIYNPSCSPLDLGSYRLERLDPTTPSSNPQSWSWSGNALALSSAVIAPQSTYSLCSTANLAQVACNRVTQFVKADKQAHSYGLWAGNNLMDTLGDNQVGLLPSQSTWIRNANVSSQDNWSTVPQLAWSAFGCRTPTMTCPGTVASPPSCQAINLNTSIPTIRIATLVQSRMSSNEQDYCATLPPSPEYLNRVIETVGVVTTMRNATMTEDALRPSCVVTLQDGHQGGLKVVYAADNNTLPLDIGSKVSVQGVVGFSTSQGMYLIASRVTRVASDTPVTSPVALGSTTGLFTSPSCSLFATRLVNPNAYQASVLGFRLDEPSRALLLDNQPVKLRSLQASSNATSDPTMGLVDRVDGEWTLFPLSLEQVRRLELSAQSALVSAFQGENEENDGTTPVWRGIGPFATEHGESIRQVLIRHLIGKIESRRDLNGSTSVVAMNSVCPSSSLSLTPEARAMNQSVVSLLGRIIACTKNQAYLQQDGAVIALQVNASRIEPGQCVQAVGQYQVDDSSFSFSSPRLVLTQPLLPTMDSRCTQVEPRRLPLSTFVEPCAALEMGLDNNTLIETRIKRNGTWITMTGLATLDMTGWTLVPQSANDNNATINLTQESKSDLTDQLVTPTSSPKRQLHKNGGAMFGLGMLTGAIIMSVLIAVVISIRKAIELRRPHRHPSLQLLGDMALERGSAAVTPTSSKMIV